MIATRRTSPLLLLLLLATTTRCSSGAPPSARTLVVAEQVHHVATVTVVQAAASEVELRYRTLSEVAERMRVTPGNLAVYVLRMKPNTENSGTIELELITEWSSADDLARCRAAASCGADFLNGETTRGGEMLYESVQ